MTPSTAVTSWRTSHAVKAMCEAAPGIIHLMDRMGVMFNRTPEGLLDFHAVWRNETAPYRFCRGYNEASNCCMRWMNRFAAGKRKAW